MILIPGLLILVFQFICHVGDWCDTYHEKTNDADIYLGNDISH